MRAARYLGVAPWALYEQAIYWQRWANVAEAAENEAQDELARRGQEGG